MNSFYLTNIRLHGEPSSLTVEDGIITAVGAENRKELPVRDGDRKSVV